MRTCEEGKNLAAEKSPSVSCCVVLINFALPVRARSDQSLFPLSSNEKEKEEERKKGRHGGHANEARMAWHNLMMALRGNYRRQQQRQHLARAAGLCRAKALSRRGRLGLFWPTLPVLIIGLFY